MAAPVFRESAFVWACVGLVGGCALAALAAWQRKFLLGLSEGFVRLPPSGKAVLVTAVVVATVFAQKPGNVSTDSHGLTRIEGEKPTALNTCAEETQSVSEGRSKSDSERSELPARAREETEGERHGEGNEVLDRIDKIDRMVGTNSPSLLNPVNPVNPVKGTPCLRVGHPLSRRETHVSTKFRGRCESLFVLRRVEVPFSWSRAALRLANRKRET